MLKRILEKTIKRALKEDKSILLLGPRQTGKTTLLKSFTFDLSVNLSVTRQRLKYEKDPSVLADEIMGLESENPLIYIDEIQKVPDLMNDIQSLIDDKKARFALTGSSERKLKKNKHFNLLPGRLDYIRMDPLSLSELPEDWGLEKSLIHGSLPGVVSTENQASIDKLLRNFVDIYLQEEIREEALVRNIGVFSRFLELAAIESGNIINFSKISQDVGVSQHTIQSYFSILEDCLIVDRVEPISENQFHRKKLIKSEKYLFYDLGVRRAAAKDPKDLPLHKLGSIFEQWVGIEILRFIRNHDLQASLRFWSDPNGPEVDWIIQFEQKYFPIEVKWTQRPEIRDGRHL